MIFSLHIRQKKNAESSLSLSQVPFKSTKRIKQNLRFYRPVAQFAARQRLSKDKELARGDNTEMRLSQRHRVGLDALSFIREINGIAGCDHSPIGGAIILAPPMIKAS